MAVSACYPVSRTIEDKAANGKVCRRKLRVQCPVVARPVIHIYRSFRPEEARIRP